MKQRDRRDSVTAQQIQWKACWTTMERPKHRSVSENRDSLGTALRPTSPLPNKVRWSLGIVIDMTQCRDRMRDCGELTDPV